MLPRSRLSLLARLALAWFALVLGVAGASPLVQPRPMQLVCGADGGVRLLVDAGSGLGDTGRLHQLDCALCLPAHAPAPAASHVERATLAPVTLADWAAIEARFRPAACAPLPARGPPSAC